METTLTGNKTLRNVEGVSCYSPVFGEQPFGVKGYEIHAGISEGASLEQPLFQLMHTEDATSASFAEGSSNEDQTVIGSYVHGLFDQPELLQQLLSWAGIEKQSNFDYPAFREQQIDRLADEVEAVMPLSLLQRLLGLNESESAEPS